MKKDSKKCIVWVKPHARLAYSKGDTCYLSNEAVEILLKNKYVELLSNDDASTSEEEISDSELNIECVFLSGHPEFAYSAGDITKLSEANANRLFAEKFIDFLSEDSDTRNSIYKKLGLPLEERE
jgi:hypothetical protein